MAVNLPDQVFAFALGILFWIVTTHAVVPRIELTNNLKKRHGLQGERCSFKIRNRSWRSAYEMSALARLFVKTNPLKSNYDIYNVWTSRSGEPYITPVLGRRNNRVVNLYLLQSPEIISSERLHGIVKRIHPQANHEFLEAVLEEFPDSFCRVYISAYDSWSGARKFFVSNRLTELTDNWDWPTSRRHRIIGSLTLVLNRLKTTLRGLRGMET